jgi:hypothetical protein
MTRKYSGDYGGISPEYWRPERRKGKRSPAFNARQRKNKEKRGK